MTAPRGRSRGGIGLLSPPGPTKVRLEAVITVIVSVSYTALHTLRRPAGAHLLNCPGDTGDLTSDHRSARRRRSAHRTTGVSVGRHQTAGARPGRRTEPRGGRRRGDGGGRRNGPSRRGPAASRSRVGRAALHLHRSVPTGPERAPDVRDARRVHAL